MTAIGSIARSRVAALRDAVRGHVVTPDDESYDQARRVWNGAIDRYPALVVRCAGVPDVVASVRFGRENDLLLAVRGGGHNVAGTGTCDGGLVVDLSPMKDIRVDPVSGTYVPNPACCGGNWTRVPRSTGWRSRAGSCPAPASPASHSAAASAGYIAGTG